MDPNQIQGKHGVSLYNIQTGLSALLVKPETMFFISSWTTTSMLEKILCEEK